MPYYPYQSAYGSSTLRPAAVSHMRIFHASPDSPPVDVYANDTLIARGLFYPQFTEYMPFSPGRYTIKVYSAGTLTTPIISTTVDLAENAIITAAITGNAANFGFLPIVDPRIQRIPGRVYLRAGNLSPDAPTVDVLLPDGSRLFTNVANRQVTDYVTVSPGTYTFYINAARTGRQLLYVPNIYLTGDRFYTIYLIGRVDAQPPLQVVIPLDGNTYIP